MDINYCEICEHRKNHDGKLTCTADAEHSEVNILECERIIPEWCPLYK